MTVYNTHEAVSMTNTKKTVFQITAPANRQVKISRLSLTTTLLTATAQELQLAKATSAATAMGAGVANPLATNSVASASTIGTWDPGQTDASSLTILQDRIVDLRAGAGFDYLPLPGCEIVLKPSEVFVLFLPTVLAGTTALVVDCDYDEGGF